MERIRPLTSRDPERVGGYRLTGRLGEGGQGVVFLGEAESGDKVAVKVLHGHSEEKARSGFLREAATARKVAPFCTARILDSGEDDGLAYVITEYIEGPSLREAVERDGPRSGAELYRLAVGTATALTAIHQAGIVHRDFKPGNVLLGPDGPRVIDFGIARSLDATVSVASGVLGTPSYMAPEQLAGAPADPVADVFAWGAMIVYAATGRPPYGQDTIPAVINRITTGKPDLGGITGPLRDLVARCLAKEVRRRPQAREILFCLLEQGDGAEGSLTEPLALEQGRATASASDEELAGARTDRWARTVVLPAGAQPSWPSTGSASWWAGRKAALAAAGVIASLVIAGAVYTIASTAVDGRRSSGAAAGALGGSSVAEVSTAKDDGPQSTPAAVDAKPTAPAEVATAIERAIAANRTASFTAKGAMSQGEDHFEADGRFEYQQGSSTNYDVTVRNPVLSDSEYEGMPQRVVLIGNNAYLREGDARVFSAAPNTQIEDNHIWMAMQARWLTSPYGISALLKSATTIDRGDDAGTMTFDGRATVAALSGDGPVAPFYRLFGSDTTVKFSLTVSRDFLPRRLDVDFWMITEGATLHSAYGATYKDWGKSGTISAP